MSEPSGAQYGGFWIRFLALLADSAIVFLLSAALLVGAAMSLDAEALVPVVFAVSLLGLLYWPVMHASGRQATFGKSILGLKVARLDGRRISILRSLWRELAKVFSAAVLMLGYLMAAVTPRKQGLHDLMAATYVVRDGSCSILAALAIAVVGFAAPVVVGPMIGAAAVLSTVTSMAEGMTGVAGSVISEHIPMKQAARRAAPPAKQASKPRPPAPKPAAAPAPAPTPAPAPAPAQTLQAMPEPIVIAQPAPLPPVAEPVKPIPPLPAAEPAKPRRAAAKPEAVPATPKLAAAKPRPAVVPPSAHKLGSGPRYNDLMTAVLYGDVDGVNELLKLGKWPDKPDSRGATPLMIAVEMGDVWTAEALLRAGANARRAVRVAQERGDSEMITLLKRYGGG